MMRKVIQSLWLLVAMLLVACGGGGGSPGANPNQPTLFTTAPSTVLVPVGASLEYAVKGGVPPYSVQNSKTQFAVGRISGDVLKITGVADGSATITVLDNKGESLAINVRTGVTGDLFTTAPAAINVATGSTTTYSITGGRPPYAAVSADAALVRASVSGNTLSIVGVAAGASTVILSDADANRISIQVGVGSSVNLTTTAQSPVVANGGSSTYTIAGGRPPYAATSNDPSVVLATVSGGNLTLSGLKTGSATVLISDMDAKTIQVAVTVQAAKALFTTAPSSLNIANAATQTFTITGGRPAYSVTSSDLSVVRAAISGDGTLSITATGPGTATVQVMDEEGTKATPIQVTVGSSLPFTLNAPGAITMDPANGPRTFLMLGGAQPYSVTSTNEAVAKGGVQGTVLTVTALRAGTATLQVADAAGKMQSLAVTVASSAPVVSSDPQLRAAGLKDAAGNATNSVSASGYTTLNVTLTDPSGQGIANQLITVTGDATQVIFPEGASGLTNASGVASIKLARASLTASGAGALTVTYSYKVGSITTYPNGSSPPTADKVIATYVGYQLAAANITLTNLDVGVSTLAAYGTRQVSVQVNLNGAPTPTPVQVNFTATCGQISPATASTNSVGIATVSYSATDAAGAAQSTQGCSGKTVEIAASTIGANVLSKTLNIQGAPATNMSFVSATPERIYLANAGGPTQSVVQFKLVNARGEPLLGQDVRLTLKTTGTTVGLPKASFGTQGNTAPIISTTDAQGLVSVPVFSGTVPTNVLVNAALVATPSVQTDSAVLTIASGRPAQARVSLAIEKFSIEGANVDGEESNVTFSLADRQGNPVPDGTAVNFVTSGGVMVPPVCTTGATPGDSRCTVKIRSQNPRNTASAPGTPVGQKTLGRVFILAYAAGEEDFVDANFNNVYDCGETWTDLGTAYRDNNLNGVFDTGEFSVPRAASTGSCGVGTAPGPDRGDGIWGAADVRAQATVVFATSAADISGTFAGTTGFTATVGDLNGNSMPTGTVITLKALDATPGAVNDVISTCTISSGTTVTIPNTFEPFTIPVVLSGCVAGDGVSVEAKTPLGLVTTRLFRLP